MGKGSLNKGILITDFNLSENNRGTAALGYGAISFLRERGFLQDGQTIYVLRRHRRLFKRDLIQYTEIQGTKVSLHYIMVNRIEYGLFCLFNCVLPWSNLRRILRNICLTAAINGGDGFSDIYGTNLFKDRLPEILTSMKYHIPLILLPQTIGPFTDDMNLSLATRIMKYAKKVYVRDKNFVKQLDDLKIEYDLTKDLSAYMQPEPWNIKIDDDAIGINVSGLAYSNNFYQLAGQFDAYPDLIEKLIISFQKLHKHVYLIPHSYRYGIPEENNDDMQACRLVYDKLYDKSGVTFVDKNLTPPQVKYVISKMSFFCGTRMHANFAAIYTNVPVFGLAYSYKFAGAFEANGLSAGQTYMINNLPECKVGELVNTIMKFYNITNVN